jgi:hypothetical protein
MNQKMYEIKTLLNLIASTAVNTSGAVDMLPSATLSRREVKVIIGYQTLTAATFTVGLSECDTTDGTYTAVAGDTIVGLYGTNTTQFVKEYHVQPTKRYMKAAVTTITGTTATVNLLVLVQNLKRSSQ